jgi:ribonuclease G
MSKELVISAASHERRVAILEEGQLVEIYIEREKEFALVGSIYKGKVTRVLPGMQSAFVDIGLDGDAFLYVSDVFENLEDYDHGHSQGDHAPSEPSYSPESSHVVEALPGETLAHSSASHAEASSSAPDSGAPDHEAHESMSPQDAAAHDEPSAAHDEPLHSNEFTEAARAAAHDSSQPPFDDERQPESNASAPQNFSPHYNPTQKYSSPRSDRGPDRGNNRGSDRSNDRGGQGYGQNDRGRGRWGRRGGRHRGGRSHGPAGRNLPPSKYASPQGDSRGNDSRGFDNRNRDNRGHDRSRDRGGYDSRGPSRGYDNRRPESPRFESSAAPSSSASAEEPILLPGESLAKYRGKPPAPASSPTVEMESHEPQLDSESVSPRASGNLGAPIPATGPSGSGGPRRFTGGLPRWLLADAAEPELAPASAQDAVASTDESPAASDSATRDASAAAPEEVHGDVELSEDQAAALASEFIEAKHEETAQKIEAGTAIGGADFDDDDAEDEPESMRASSEVELTDEEEEDEEETEEESEVEDAEGAEEETEEEQDEREAAEQSAARDSELSHDDSDAEAEGQSLRPSERAELEADAAHESAERAAAAGDFDHATSQEDHAEAEHTSAASGEFAQPASAIPDDAILLPGETRAPHAPGAPREEFRDSARIGGNPRARFQRPQRGGRDRGDRGPRGRHDRGGRPGGHRFERRGPGGPRHDRHHRGHSGPPRRPQLISEMLKAGQDVVIQIAKEPLGKKGARITSHVALPGRFLVYMPTIDHIGVSRKIASAENRSRLRRLVGEARGSYPGGFIVRTAAGGATDDEIRTDIEFLGKTWNEIKQRSEERKSPALLHRDLNLVERILRDYVSDDFTGIWIDNEEEYGKIVEFVSRFQPKLVNKVKLYTKETPIFEEFGIQHELDKALRAKVWLKSGGYIVINHTEALVAIDVNTGKFVGKGSTRLEDTIVKTNLEAVKEIVRQIRLRDLGGIIVVDFIDMEERRNREKVLSALQQALEQDKAPSKALSFNEFGLVCITRKRTKQALERVLCQPCPYCTGSGMVKSIPTLCYEIQSEARKMATASETESPNLTLRVHPEIAKALKTRESMLMDELEQTSHKHVIIQSDATLHWEQYDIY